MSQPKQPETPKQPEAPKEQPEELRVGVFVCHCGLNIAGTVDVHAVAEYAKTIPDVVYVKENRYTCADPGQEEIRKAIREQKLNRVVVAACSPRMHEPTFRRTVSEAGLNPFLYEMANIREFSSWCHQNAPEEATERAKDFCAHGCSQSPINDAAANPRSASHQQGTNHRRRHRRHERCFGACGDGL